MKEILGTSPRVFSLTITNGEDEIKIDIDSHEPFALEF
ncbi:MAG: hypothetical protein ACI93R_004229 [Flavobacteriales bacterium]|jgi:hypothetical protein